MKNINRKKLNDPIDRIRKHPKYKEYAQDARNRIDLAIEIYNFRKQKRLSQAKLAKKASTTQKVISKIENAQMNVGWDLIMRILGSLGLKLEVVDPNKQSKQCKQKVKVVYKEKIVYKEVPNYIFCEIDKSGAKSNFIKSGAEIYDSINNIKLNK